MMAAEKIVILNPQAKQGRALELCRLLQKRHPEIEVYLTEAPRNAVSKTKLAVAQGAKVVIAAGGDGTINEVAHGLSGENAALGILPFGTVNVFARELGIPLDFEKAWQVIEKGNKRCVDLAEVHCSQMSGALPGDLAKFVFVQMAGVGLDAEIIRSVSPSQKKKWGPLSYVFQFFKSASKYHPKISVKVDENPPVSCSSVLIGNGRFYAGPFSIFKNACPDDGHLDLRLFFKSGLGPVLHYIFSMAGGRLEENPGIKCLKGKRIDITSLKSVPVEIDGELAGFTPVSFHLIPHSLQVIVP
jgi:diacylglycerol kinase (ATP)